MEAHWPLRYLLSLYFDNFNNFQRQNSNLECTWVHFYEVSASEMEGAHGYIFI